MTPERWQRIKSVYGEAMERSGPEREEFVQQACGADHELREEVETLLREQVSSSLQSPIQSADWTGRDLGHFRLIEKIGEGGMGVVYRARDSKLGRDVAIKMLPAELSNDPQRLVRFRSEARLLAQINHPNVASIYGVEESEGRYALVMELVEGPTLADRIARGPLPLDEALAIAKRIAEAIEKAHARGIVHRDLKPANVKIDREGRVKVLDFGLAKAVFGEVEPEGTTFPAPTDTGIVMGTVAYMSPEQARGGRVDARSDVWSFGVLLFEMLAGGRPFRGATTSDTMAVVLTEEPDWAALPSVPQSLRDLVGRCLRKDRCLRLQSIGDARITIQEVAENTQRKASGATASAPVSPSAPAGALAPLPRWIPIGLAAAALAGVVATWFPKPDSPRLEQQVVRFSVPAPEGAVIRSFEVSPDGRHLAFVARHEDTVRLRKFALQLDHAVGEVAISPNGRYLAYTKVISAIYGIGSVWVRDLETGATRQLVEEPIVRHLMWSPNSDFLAFGMTEPQGGRGLAKVAVRDGSRVRLCDLPVSCTGGVWTADGKSIVFTSRPAALYEVPARGGTPRLLFDPKERDPKVGFFHPAWLSAENGHPALVFTRGAPVFFGEADLQNLDIMVYRPNSGKEPVQVGVGFAPVLAHSGHLVYYKSSALWALPFSATSLSPTGEPFPIAEVQAQGPTVARDGTLAYLRVEELSQMQLVWRDRGGGELEKVGEPQVYISGPALAPGGRGVAVSGGKRWGEDVWIHDLSRPNHSRLTFADGWDINPVWSPDGKEIFFSSNRDGDAGLFVKSADGAGEDQKVAGRNRGDIVQDWSSDGRYVIFVSHAPDTKRDLWYLERDEDGRWSDSNEFLKTAFEERAAAFSADGRFVAYVSNESGRDEVFVKPFPAGDGKWQLSKGGGTQPRWNPDGSEIFYVQHDTLIAASIEMRPRFSVGDSQVLFSDPQLVGLYASPTFDVAPDGQRFLLVGKTGEPKSTIQIVQNWYEEFREQKP